MRRLRNVVYINSAIEHNCILYYGIEFKEFVKLVPKPLDNLLLLKHEYWGADLHQQSMFTYVKGKGIEELIKEDIYMYGDFCWVDFEDEDCLDGLSKQDIAELLYLGHLYEPFETPFSNKLNNRYIYCAHDDGYRCVLYCRYICDVADIIANLILNTVATSKRRRILPLQNEIKSELLNLSEGGLLFDFNGIQKSERRISIPFYIIGEFEDMNIMYSDIRGNIGRAKLKAELVYKNKSWQIERW